MDRTLLFKTSELNLVDLYAKCIGDKYIIHGFYGYVDEFCFKGITLQHELCFVVFFFLGPGRELYLPHKSK